MNSCQLIGRLTRDPELRIVGSTQKPVTNFTLAVNREFSKDNKADFFRVVVWGNQAEPVAQYLKKGSQCAVVGSVQINEYTDKEGNKRQSVDIQANRVEFLSSGQKSKPVEDEATPFDMIDDEDVPF